MKHEVTANNKEKEKLCMYRRNIPRKRIGEQRQNSTHDKEKLCIEGTYHESILVIRGKTPPRVRKSSVCIEATHHKCVQGK
jgi:hypothetical protein